MIVSVLFYHRNRASPCFDLNIYNSRFIKDLYMDPNNNDMFLPMEKALFS